MHTLRTFHIADLATSNVRPAFVAAHHSADGSKVVLSACTAVRAGATALDGIAELQFGPDYSPELGTDLVTALAGLDVDNLTPACNQIGRRTRRVSNQMVGTATARRQHGSVPGNREVARARSAASVVRQSLTS
jgi:hypothetical protein